MAAILDRRASSRRRPAPQALRVGERRRAQVLGSGSTCTGLSAGLGVGDLGVGEQLRPRQGSGRCVSSAAARQPRAQGYAGLGPRKIAGRETGRVQARAVGSWVEPYYRPAAALPRSQVAAIRRRAAGPATGIQTVRVFSKRGSNTN